MELGASATHEVRKLEAVEEAASALARALEQYEQARGRRDAAVRAAVNAGVRPGRVAKAAGLSPGRVSHLVIAPRR